MPSFIGDGMVLQRDSRIGLWGWADEGESVQIVFHGVTVKTKADSRGRWTTSFGPFDAGGPYDITVKGKNSLAIHSVMLGDVWLASGQSNMEFPLRQEGGFGGVVNAEQEIKEAEFPQMRLFKVHRSIAVTPQKNVEADHWTSVTPETVGSFSAVAYLFGRELYRRYHVPIGLIESCWSGTVAEAWMSEGSLRSFPEFQKSIQSLTRIDEASAIAEYNQYVNQKEKWDGKHSTEDRGYIDGRYIWAAPDFNDSTWSTIAEPQTSVAEALKGFDGIVWFRRYVEVLEGYGGKSLQVHMALAGQHDTTFFNGEKIGETEGWGAPRDYVVPAHLVKSGRNVITVRMKGSEGYVGFFGEPEKMNLTVGDSAISLAGTWHYRTGPDLNGLLEPSEFARFHVDPNTSTLLFNGMIAPLTTYRIKGVIWYQGEWNADRATQYRTLFPTLIQDWRQHWGYTFPFLFVQLAGFQPNKAEPADYAWADLREAQGMALSLPNTAMATAVDIGDERDIHPRNKQDVAHRLALAALKVAYGESIVYSGPKYESMRIEGDRVRIKFSEIGSGLLINDVHGYLRGFEVAGADGKFVLAQALQDGPDVLAFSKSVARPVAVRYDWSNMPNGNLYNIEGLPATPFRTDGP